MTDPIATEIRVRRASRQLEVAFDDGSTATLPAEYLRVESPSAEVQGHMPGEKKLVPGKRAVNIDSVDPIGHYAIRICFSDGHDTGIYAWEFLHRLGTEHGERWAAYLEALAREGQSRDG